MIFKVYVFALKTDLSIIKFTKTLTSMSKHRYIFHKHTLFETQKPVFKRHPFCLKFLWISLSCDVICSRKNLFKQLCSRRELYQDCFIRFMTIPYPTILEDWRQSNAIDSLLRKSSKRNSPRNKTKFCFLVRYSLQEIGLQLEFLEAYYIKKLNPKINNGLKTSKDCSSFGNSIESFNHWWFWYFISLVNFKRNVDLWIVLHTLLNSITVAIFLPREI